MRKLAYAAAAAQSAPGLFARDALREILDAISEHDEADVKYPVELIVSIQRIAELAMRYEQPAPSPSFDSWMESRGFGHGYTFSREVVLAAYMAGAFAAAMADEDERPAPGDELAKLRETLDRVLGWFTGDGTYRDARATRAQLAHAYRDGGLPVGEELRRFL